MIAAARPLPLRLVDWADTVTRYAAWFAMALLAAAIMVTVVDVCTRRTIGWSVPGLVDITQLLVMSFVYFSIPFGFMRESNVSVDFVTDRFPPRALAFVKGACALLGAAFMAGITAIRGTAPRAVRERRRLADHRHPVCVVLGAAADRRRDVGGRGAAAVAALSLGRGHRTGRRRAANR